jgi:serine protease Do
MLSASTQEELSAMRIANFLAAALCGIGALAAYAQTSPEQRATINKASLAVYRMHATYSDDRGASGSAIHLGGGRFATSCHLTRDAKGVRISRGAKQWDAHYQHKNVDRDLCIVLTREAPEHSAQLADVSKMKVGQRVYAVGFPAALTGRMTQFGTIRALYDFDGGKVIRTGAFFAQGESGGALFDGEGKVLGVLTFKSRSGPGHNFVVPANWIDEVEPRAKDAPSPEGARAFWEPDFYQPPAFLAAAALEASERWAELEQFAREWVAGTSHDPEPLLTLGKALYHLRQERAALEPLRKALEIDPDHAESWFQLALVHAKLNDAAERDKAMARVAALSPDRVEDLSDIAVAPAAAGDCVKDAASSAGC